MKVVTYRKFFVNLGLLFLFVCTSVLFSASTKETFNPTGSGDLFPDGADGRKTEVPAINAYPLKKSKIKIDGKLDDPAWEKAEAAKGFGVWDPNRGDDPVKETVFKIAYDDDALYIGFAAFEDDPSKMSGGLNRRDNLAGCDAFGVYVDPYHDHTTAFNYMVSLAGAKTDRYVYNDGDMDYNWDSVWEVETSFDENGWYGEYRIPFSSMRFKHSDSMTWGLNVYRSMRKRGEVDAWTTWDKQTPGLVSRFGELRGLDGIPSKTSIKILPYIVHSTTDPGYSPFGLNTDTDKLSHYHNFGADLSMSVTSNLTLNATFQPDFGQVEADPAVLNISPFETHYSEKRPFFTEGAQYFMHPDFIMFHSRRIGTDNINSRIRAAGKLLGKTAGGISVAAMYAATDITGEGQAHNFLKSGEQVRHYTFGRFGREFQDGAHQFNLSQSAVFKTDDRDKYGYYATRDAYTTGADFDLNFFNRKYNIHGSFIGSVIDPAASQSDLTLDHEKIFGTGGTLRLAKNGGLIRGGISGTWQGDRLDINDFGFIEAPDDVEAKAWAEYEFIGTPGESLFRKCMFEAEVSRNWLYAGGDGLDFDSGGKAWEYGQGHHRVTIAKFGTNGQLYSNWDVYAGLSGASWATTKYETRYYAGRRGPLLSIPPSYWYWAGFHSDHRADYKVALTVTNRLDFDWGYSNEISLRNQWNTSTRQNYFFSLNYKRYYHGESHIANLPNPGNGIGGVSYLFARLHQEIIDFTLRANFLFTRDLSLQLYFQPFTTTGDYYDPSELAQPDSYDFKPIENVPGFDPERIDMFDFRYAAINTNVVLRWEYAAGSTFYFVWKQGYENYVMNDGSQPTSRDLFNREPENVILAKLSYWFTT